MSVTLLRVWQFGSAMVIFLAALQNVPQSQYEAAMIDGASKWQMFMKVTVPLITPVIFFNFIMQTTPCVPRVYRPVRDNRRRSDLLHLPVLTLYLRYRL